MAMQLGTQIAAETSTGVAALIGAFHRLAQGGVAPYIVLLVLALAVYLPGVLRLPAVDRTEIVFADTTREMVARGAWTDPRYGDVVHQFRPIGTFWAQGVVARLAGPEQARNITVYRLPSLVAVVLAVLAVFWLAAPRVGRDAALLAAGLFAVAPLTVLVSQLAIADGLALLPATVAMLALLRIYDAVDGQDDPRLALLFWTAMGFGMLVNALHTPILVGVTLLALFVFDRDVSWLRRTRPLMGLPIALALASPWLAVRVMQDGVPFAGMGWSEFLAALGGAQDMKLRAFPGTFTAAALIGFLPGVALLPAAMKALWDDRAQRLPRFLLAWTIGYIVYLELLSSKPGTYTVQVMFPAFALAVALLVMSRRRGGSRCASPLSMRRWAPPIGRRLARHCRFAVPAGGIVRACRGGLWLRARVAVACRCRAHCRRRRVVRLERATGPSRRSRRLGAGRGGIASAVRHHALGRRLSGRARHLAGARGCDGRACDLRCGPSGRDPRFPRAVGGVRARRAEDRPDRPRPCPLRGGCCTSSRAAGSSVISWQIRANSRS